MMDQYDDYFSSCGLCLNRSKCMVIIFRSKAKTQDIMLNGSPEVEKVKLLGLWVDSRYEFADHVAYLTKIVSYKLSCIRKVALWLSDENLKKVVESLVISHISYCSEIYLRTLKVRKKIQKLVNSAARVATRNNRYANCETMMNKLGWLNMNNFYQVQLLCSLRRMLGNGSSVYPQRLLDWQSRSGIRTRLLRLTWKPNNKHGKSNFIQTAVTTWNTYKLGKQVFAKYQDFKEWICSEAKRLYGNKNLV